MTQRVRFVLICASLLAVSSLHFSTATEGHWAHLAHVVFRKFYFLPIIMSAVWFGLRGALLCAGAVVGVYGLHMWANWSPEPFERIDQVGEMVSFVVLAVVSGALVMLERLARTKAERVRRNAERDRVGTAVAALAETLGARDRTTLEHSQRVARLVEKFAVALNLPHGTVRSLFLAGIVHDIGKVGVRDDVLLKPDSLTTAERDMIMEHPKIAAKILQPIGFHDVVRYAAVHHENIDGSGYPEGLKGDEIPLPGRILAIADTYDALCAERPYKTSLSEAEAHTVMLEMAGKKLDADLLDKFWQFMERGQVATGDVAAGPGSEHSRGSGSTASPNSKSRSWLAKNAPIR